MNPLVAELEDLLKLERLEDNLFRGKSRDIGTARVFGGQVLGQAVAAATATIEQRDLHSLHAYFLRAGDPAVPIVYDVDRARDGRSFSVRRVVAVQHGRPIFNMAASFQVEESGLEHQMDMPDVPLPEGLSDRHALTADKLEKIPDKLRRWVTRKGPFEFRPVVVLDPIDPPKQPPTQQVWMRCRDRVDGPLALHRAMLAYVSDYYLIGTACLPHGISFLKGNVQMASLDHAMWFHRPFRVDEWLLYACDSPSSSGARGLARGLIYNRRGQLVAATAQEGLVRLWEA